MREAVRVLMGPPARFMLGPAYLRPVAAVALVALGFFSARLTAPKVYAPAGLGSSGPVASRIRYIQPDASGRVEIVLDETRQRVVTGRLDDEPILRMLLAAAKDPSDPGLRGESVELLKDHAASSEVRSALLEALRRDPNAGVRLQAMEGLRSFSREPASRKALIEALLSDVNPGVRTQAIDLLMQQRDAAMAPAFQESLRREDNNYVRLRVQNALREMNASMETF
jgi:HEAT repeat protein